MKKCPHCGYVAGDPLKDYVFHREEGFYLVGLCCDRCALDSVPMNLGTTRVTEAVTGDVIYDVRNN